MKGLPIGPRVRDPGQSAVRGTRLFGVPPTIERPGHAKRIPVDPRINFAMSIPGARPGIDRPGLQAEGNRR